MVSGIPGNGLVRLSGLVVGCRADASGFGTTDRVSSTGLGVRSRVEGSVQRLREDFVDSPVIGVAAVALGLLPSAGVRGLGSALTDEESHPRGGPGVPVGRGVRGIRGGLEPMWLPSSIGRAGIFADVWDEGVPGGWDIASRALGRGSPGRLGGMCVAGAPMGPFPSVAGVSPGCSSLGSDAFSKSALANLRFLFLAWRLRFTLRRV